MTRLRTALAEPANPVRAGDGWTPPTGALRQVLVHLTPLAPALEGRDLSDDARWRWLAWVTPAAVVSRVLMRLQRRADQVALRAFAGLDGVEIHDGAEAPSAGCERLLAIVFDAPVASIVAAHADLLQPQCRVGSGGPAGPTTAALQRDAA